MKRAVLKIVELSATAADRSARVTRLGIMARRAGWLMALTTPIAAARANSQPIVIAPAQVSAASAIAWTMARHWVTLTTAKRSRRSAKVPAIGLRITVGNRSANDTNPS